MNRLRNPLGLSDFKTIRKDGCYYVDKTALIHDLVEHGYYYFLSRPRRFGKSTLINTLKSLFEGKQSLFEGLKIYDYWDWSVQYPVVHMSFGTNYTKIGQVDSDSKSQLEDLETEYGFDPMAAQSYESPARLRSLLKSLNNKTGKKVVVLIDEYDKPILDAIENVEVAKENREFLRGFYGAIKDSAEHVRFVFVTGISMFSKVSLFSGLNNLEDISLDPRYATICGYTEDDLDTVFAPELEELDREEIRRWYNGYSWRGDRKVYNPYDVLTIFKRREFEHHWFETGTPTFLYQVMKNHRFTPLDVESLQIPRKQLAKFEVDEFTPAALMFQAGYLTIAGEERIGSETHFRLDYPNLEIRESLNGGFLSYISERPHEVSLQTSEMCRLLMARDFEGFSERLRALLAGIPYQWYGTEEVSRYEAWYAAILYSCFESRGYQVRGEDSISGGQSDLVVEHGDQVFVIELKMADRKEALEQAALDAIEQIETKGYANKYRAQGNVIHLLGIAFSREDRGQFAVKDRRI